jgi:hypothetical protein
MPLFPDRLGGWARASAHFGGGFMTKDDRHADFEINFIENNQIKITTDDCSIITEYIEDIDVRRTTMSPANILFSAFAL